MKKRLLTLLAVGVLSLGVVGCSSKPAETTGPKEVKVGVAIYKFDDNFMTVYREELQAYFATKNTAEVTYTVDVQDGKGDQAEQTNQIQNWITAKYDVIIANLVQSTSAQTITDMCKAAVIQF